MKRSLLFALFTCILLLTFIAAAYASAPSPAFDAKAKILAQRDALAHLRALKPESLASKARYERLAKMVSRKGGKSFNPFDTLSVAVAFEADEAAGTIDTRTEHTIRATEDQVEYVEFYLTALDSFSVEDGGGTPVDFVYEAGTGVATVHLPTVLDEGDEQVLVFLNAGTPNCDPDSFFGMTFCMVSPEIVFFASVDWMALKAPYEMEDLYSDASMTLDVATPADYVAAATLDLESVTPSGDKLVHHFVSDFGLTYLGLAYAQYDTFQGATTDGAKPVKTYIHSGATTFGQDWADICTDVIDYFETVYSPYIYNKHDVIQAIQELGGGVGPQSATFYYAGALTTDPQSFTAESIFSHEIAHQWWGNIVRMGDNYSPWLNEGFAEYSSRLYGYQVWSERYQDYLYDYYFHIFQLGLDLSGEVPMTGTGIFSAEALMYQAVTYWKGSHFLRMLQWKLGDDAFFPAMNDYAHMFSSDVSDELVTVDSLKAIAETASSQNLDNFYQTWVYETGFPIYRYSAQFDEVDGAFKARVHVEQIQDTDKVYDLPVEVEIWVGSETEARKFSLAFDGKTADGEYDLDAEPRGLSVDDSAWIWGDKVPALAGDVDSSNEVDGLDLIYTAWAQGGVIMDYDHWNYYVETDFNRDGKVDEADLQATENNFGKKGSIDE